MIVVERAGSVEQNQRDPECLVLVMVLPLIGGVIPDWLLSSSGPQFPISSHWSLAAFPALWMECRVKQSWAGSFLWRVSLESYDLKAELAFYYQGPVLNFVIIQTSCFSYPPMPLFNDWARGVKVGTLNQMLLLGTSCDDLGGRLKLFFFNQTYSILTFYTHFAISPKR